MANVFGVTSAKMNRRMVMRAVEMTSPIRWKWRTARDVASVEPPIVARSVSSSTTFR
jgi:hypothetical protein